MIISHSEFNLLNILLILTYKKMNGRKFCITPHRTGTYTHIVVTV